MEGIFQRIDSNSDQETYPGLFYAPSPRLMTGSRDHRSIPSFAFTIVNEKYESTVDIDYKLWKFGKLGAVSAMLSSMGEKARMFPNQLTADLINAGSAAGSTGNDGQIFYSALHVDPGARYTTAQNNTFTSAAATGTAPTVLEMYSALQSHRAAYDGFKDGEGDPVIPTEGETFTVLCSSENIQAARAVFMNDQITGPIANELKGMFRPRINPWSDVDAEFFTFRTQGSRKAFLYQVAEPVRLTDNLGGDSNFETEDVSFGTFGFYNVGYGDWRYTTRHIFT
jgi:phage major head subunit gpT-like protein